MPSCLPERHYQKVKEGTSGDEMSYLGVKKRLRDFPRDEWIEAAGLCGHFDDEDGVECEEKVEVTIQKGEEADTAWMQIRCDGGHTEEDVVGWKVNDEPVSLGSLGNFFPLLSRANCGYCASCGRIIVGSRLYCLDLTRLTM